jgi:hypothetical protein
VQVGTALDVHVAQHGAAGGGQNQGALFISKSSSFFFPVQIHPDVCFRLSEKIRQVLLNFLCEKRIYEIWQCSCISPSCFCFYFENLPRQFASKIRLYVFVFIRVTGGQGDRQGNEPDAHHVGLSSRGQQQSATRHLP